MPIASAPIATVPIALNWLALRLALLLSTSLLLWSPSVRADCSDPFSNPNEIVDFHLETTTATWAAFQASEPETPNGEAAPGLGATDCEAQYPYFQARFRCGDESEWLTVGFRRKPDRTESRFKLPIKLDFNRFVDGQRWPAALGELGFRRLSLNSGQSDQPAGGGFGNGQGSNPSVLSALLTEHLAWRLMREELPAASGSAYARLTVRFSDSAEVFNQGLYILVEDIDRTTVRARFGADQGATYKTSDPGCIDQVVFEDAAPNSASDGFRDWLALDPAAFAGSWYARTNQALHLDELLRQEALRELLANTEDTILGRMNNYFSVDLYGRRRVYLPWDLDDMFRPHPQVHPVDTPLVSSCVGLGDTCAPIPLGVNIRDNAELRPLYLEILCRLSNGVADESKLLSDLSSIDALIRPLIAAEIPGVWQPEGLDPLDVEREGTYASEVERMREWIPGRVAAVRSLIEAEGVLCSRGCDAGAVAACDYYGCPSQRTCAAGLWGPCEKPTPAFVAGEDANCDGSPEDGPPAPGASAPTTEEASDPSAACACRLEGEPRASLLRVRGAIFCLAILAGALVRRRGGQRGLACS